MSNTPEYKCMKDCVPELRIAVKGHLLSLSGELLASRLVNEDKDELLRNDNKEESKRAAELVMLVMNKVKENTKNFQDLLGVFNRTNCEDIAKKLEEKCKSYSEVKLDVSDDQQENGPSRASSRAGALDQQESGPSRASGSGALDQQESGPSRASGSGALDQQESGPSRASGSGALDQQESGPSGTSDIESPFLCDLSRISHSSSSFDKVKNPIVRFNELHEDDLEDLYAQMNQLTKVVQKEFLTFLAHIHDSFKQHVDYNTLILILERDEILIFKDADFSAAKDVSDVFRAIRPHCSYFNYEILQTLVEILGSAEDKQRLQKYLTAFKQYCNAMPCAETICGTAKGSSKRLKLSFKLNYDRETLKPDQLRSIKCTIAQHLNIRPSSLYLCTVKEGCVELEFLVPAFLCERIFPLTEAQKEALCREVKALAITCDGQKCSEIYLQDDITEHRRMSSVSSFRHHDKVYMDDKPESWQDQQRLYNFLKHYDLLHYHKKFLEKGVRRLSHLKDVAVDDASLDEIGLTRPERLRLRKKVKENVEWMGKFKKRIAGKQNRFDEPAPQVAHTLMEMEYQTRTAAIITKDQITLGQRIGEGAHGSVYEGTWANVHGSVAVAVKTLYGKQEAQGQFIKEANSMCSLNHKHIIQLYGIVLSHPLMLVEELALFGSLYKYLKEHGSTMNLERYHIYTTQIAEAMKYLEGRRVVHRDLATRNILLTNQNYVKLSDFGMARVLDDNSEVYNLSNLGARIPIAWTAPEALTRAKFSTASDVWSYGVVLWEIYSLGKIPWDGLSPIKIRDLLLRGERLARPDRCPLDMYEVMLECWEQDSQERPTFGAIVEKLESIVCQKVRALKPHIVDDEDSISFKTGELIFLIDKPKPGWMFGMTEGGNIGYFQSDYVTTYIDPVGDLKEKLTSKKAKAGSKATFSSQYSFATATLNENGKGKATKLAKFSNEEEALVPSSVRFIYQRPTATSTASTTSSADVSTGSVRQGGATEPQAPPIPERPHRTHFDQPLSSASTPPMIHRGKLMSESDAGSINDAVGVAHPPVIPRRPHPPNPRHETSSGAGGVNLSPAAKAKKPPMPPPRLKTNAGPHHEVSPRSPRLSPSHHIITGGGGGKTAAKLSDTEMKIQTLILSDPEFQGCSPDVCLKLLKRHGFEMSSAKEDIRVHMLMEMGIEHIETEDCRRALSHCQQKMDRAAEWLLEQSADIERRRQ